MYQSARKEILGGELQAQLEWHIIIMNFYRVRCDNIAGR
jgi:hypothetical protein